MCWFSRHLYPLISRALARGPCCPHLPLLCHRSVGDPSLSMPSLLWLPGPWHPCFQLPLPSAPQSYAFPAWSPLCPGGTCHHVLGMPTHVSSESSSTYSSFKAPSAHEASRPSPTSRDHRHPNAVCHCTCWTGTPQHSRLSPKILCLLSCVSLSFLLCSCHLLAPQLLFPFNSLLLPHSFSQRLPPLHCIPPSVEYFRNTQAPPWSLDVTLHGSPPPLLTAPLSLLPLPLGSCHQTFAHAAG